jgi:hypothetical protein
MLSQPTLRSCGVNRVAEALQCHSALEKIVDDIDQVPERAAEPIEFPDHQYITGPLRRP